MRTLATKARAINQYNGLGNQLWDLAGNRPSLDLRFAEEKSLVDATTGTTLVNHTRASSGTYVGSDGLIKTATTNYFLYSEDVQNAFAVKSGLQNPIPSDTVPGPFSGTLADEMREANTTGGHYLEKNTLEPSNRTWTFSVYAKRFGNPRIVWLTLYADGYTSLINGSFNLDAQTASLTAPQGTGTPISANILPVGDGWFRLSLTGVPTTAAVSDLKPRIVLINNSTVYTGETDTGLYLWGTQLEQSSTVGEYIPTTSTINSAPRFDHDPTTGESLGLLVEEQRTNLLLNSGTLSTQSVTVTAVDYALSFTGTGTVTLSGASTAGPLVGTGTGEANRVSLTFTPTAGSLTLTVSGTVTDAQLEAGSFPTSYIPTTGTTVTRAADVASISGSNFSSWANNTAGTIFSDSTVISSTTQTQTTYHFDGPTYDISLRQPQGTGDKFRANIGNVFTPSPGTGDILSSGTTKSAVAYDETTGRLQVGMASDDVTLAGSIDATDLRLGSLGLGTQLNGRIKRLTFWPTRLPNETLQTITN